MLIFITIFITIFSIDHWSDHVRLITIKQGVAVAGKMPALHDDHLHLYLTHLRNAITKRSKIQNSKRVGVSDYISSYSEVSTLLASVRDDGKNSARRIGPKGWEEPL